MGKADLHIHTLASDGLLDPRDVVEYAASQTDLSVVAIADHDTLDGAWQAWRWLQAHPQPRLDFLWGVEMTAARFRHLLFYWPERPPRRLPRRWLSPGRLIAMMAETGAVCVAAHPTNLVSLSGPEIEDLLLQGLPLHGMEICSPPLGRRKETRLRHMAHKLRLAPLGGSDAHGLLQVIGAAHTLFPGQGRHDLLRALLAGNTEAGWNAIPVQTPLSVLARQFIRAWIAKPGLLQRGH